MNKISSSDGEGLCVNGQALSVVPTQHAVHTHFYTASQKNT